MHGPQAHRSQFAADALIKIGTAGQGRENLQNRTHVLE